MRRTIFALALAALATPALAQPAPATPPAAPQATPPTSENCFWLIRRDGKLDKDEAPGLRLLETTGALQRPETTGRVEGIYCDRDSLLPGEWDDRVPRTLGIPLFLNGPGGITTVEIFNSRFRVSFSRAVEVSPQLQAAAKALVDRWQSRPSPIR